jgi:glycerol-3-phosphate O-acyltransferase
MVLEDLPGAVQEQMRPFYDTFMAIMERRGERKRAEELLKTYFSLIVEQVQNPFPFSGFHEAEREPLDFYRLGQDLLNPLIDVEKSTLLGAENLEEMEEAIRAGSNVILLVNHQSEMDPQIISSFLDERGSLLGRNMICIAGHRVVEDPITAPLCRGRNLLCVWSKKYLDFPPEKRAEKLQHNFRTLRILEKILKAGGAFVYIAPSGGRERPDEDGKIHVARFDPDSIEMLSIISEKSKTPTLFYTLALSSYAIMPPPDEVKIEIGEERKSTFHPAHLYFGKRVDMNAFPAPTKLERREARAQGIWQQLVNDYKLLPK